jgi:hypothetical protein
LIKHGIDKMEMDDALEAAAASPLPEPAPIKRKGRPPRKAPEPQRNVREARRPDGPDRGGVIADHATNGGVRKTEE